MAEPKSENRKTKTGPGQVPPIRDFTDLVAWKLARELRSTIYRLSKQFPPDERHALTVQIRRAAVSVTANLAEGYGRYSYQENSQFCRLSRGSIYEVRDHLTTALDQAYISPAAWKDADALARRVIQVVNGYIRSTQQLQKEKGTR
jgi:four helix bundle protein